MYKGLNNKAKYGNQGRIVLDLYIQPLSIILILKKKKKKKEEKKKNEKQETTQYSQHCWMLIRLRGQDACCQPAHC